MMRASAGERVAVGRPPGATRLHVRVPASTANLGAGFDCVGLALTLYNEVLFDLDAEPTIQHVGRDAALLRTQENLVCTAMHHFERATGITIPPHALTQINGIPSTRGLGSSAAAIIAGLVAANEISGQPLETDEILQLGGELEGHADNVGAALLGGLVVSYVEANRYHAVPVSVGAPLRAVVFVPQALLPTEEARAALPERPPLSDAIHNVGRAALLAVALQQGRFEYLSDAMQDRLHQPYRLPMVPGLDELMLAAVEAGAYGACLSGAGPSILALTAPELAGNVAEQMCLVARRLDRLGDALELDICFDGSSSAWEC